MTVGIVLVVLLNALVSRRWPHFTMNCAHGCRRSHDRVRAFADGAAFASVVCLLALAAEWAHALAVSP